MASNAKSARKKDYPCLRCDQHVKRTDAAVQCALCDLWVHKACENMSEETFKVLDTQNAQTGQCFWCCKSCKNYALKFDKRMRDVEKRVQDLETAVPKLSTDVQNMQGEIEKIKDTNVKLSKEVKEVGSGSKAEVTTHVFTEMRERESRKCNIIIHNLPEPGAEIIDKDERITKDKNSVEELCRVIGVELDVKEVSRFAKRLGAPSADRITPRPLLVGFKLAEHCDAVLENAPLLSEKDEPWTSVNIIRDLTKIQRKEEEDMRTVAETKNAERSEEEAENWMWKVVGRRGERRIVKVSLEEVETEEGQEGRRGQARGRGRGRPRKKRGVGRT